MDAAYRFGSVEFQVLFFAICEPKFTELTIGCLSRRLYKFAYDISISAKICDLEWPLSDN